MSELLARLARMKFRAMRLAGYITVLNTIILIFGFGWKWWYLPVLCLTGALYFFEKYYGVAGDMDVSYSQSREWRELRADVTRIKELLQDKL